MGEFRIRVVDAEGRQVDFRRIKNTLHYEGVWRILKKLFPPHDDISMPPCKLGLSGAISHTSSERPNHNPFAPEVDAFDPATTLEDLTGIEPNEGGLPWASILGYERQPPVGEPMMDFTITGFGDGAVVETPEFVFHNIIDWIQQGYPSDTDPMPRPWDLSWHAWEPEIGFPWQIPSVHPETFGSDPEGYAAFLAYNLFRIAGYPINVAFLQNLGTDWELSDDDELMASCTLMTAPVLWRPGATLYVKYSAWVRGEVSTSHGIFVGMALNVAEQIIRSGDPPSDEPYQAVLVSNPPGSITPQTKYSELMLIEEAESKELGHWNVYGDSGSSPYSMADNGPFVWENTGEVDWSEATYLVILGSPSDSGDDPMPAWYQAIDPPLVLAPGDTLTLPDVKFEVLTL